MAEDKLAIVITPEAWHNGECDFCSPLEQQVRNWYFSDKTGARTILFTACKSCEDRFK